MNTNLINNWESWLFFYKINDVINLLNYSHRISYFLYIFDILYLQPKEISQITSIKPKQIHIIDTDNRLKYSIVFFQNYIQYLYILLEIDPFKTCLLFLILYYHLNTFAKWIIPFSFIILTIFVCLSYEKVPAFILNSIPIFYNILISIKW